MTFLVWKVGLKRNDVFVAVAQRQSGSSTVERLQVWVQVPPAWVLKMTMVKLDPKSLSHGWGPDLVLLPADLFYIQEFEEVSVGKVSQWQSRGWDLTAQTAWLAGLVCQMVVTWRVTHLWKWCSFIPFTFISQWWGWHVDIISVWMSLVWLVMKIVVHGWMTKMTSCRCRLITEIMINSTNPSVWGCNRWGPSQKLPVTIMGPNPNIW